MLAHADAAAVAQTVAEIVAVGAVGGLANRFAANVAGAVRAVNIGFILDIVIFYDDGFRRHAVVFIDCVAVFVHLRIGIGALGIGGKQNAISVILSFRVRLNTGDVIFGIPLHLAVGAAVETIAAVVADQVMVFILERAKAARAENHFGVAGFVLDNRSCTDGTAHHRVCRFLQRGVGKGGPCAVGLFRRLQQTALCDRLFADQHQLAGFIDGIGAFDVADRDLGRKHRALPRFGVRVLCGVFRRSGFCRSFFRLGGCFVQLFGKSRQRQHRQHHQQAEENTEGFSECFLHRGSSFGMHSDCGNLLNTLLYQIVSAFRKRKPQSFRFRRKDFPPKAAPVSS